MVIEGRDRILMLRRADGRATDLVDALAAFGARQSARNAPHFRITAVGEPRTLQVIALDQLIDIGKEAIRNSFQHARAGRIDVRIEYRRRSLMLHISDDGSGLPTSESIYQSKPGHFGLTGMRERAEELGAQIWIERKEPTGTQVRVVVPACVAFTDAQRSVWAHRLDETLLWRHSNQ
jgi:signal transduction histidine kinase